MRSNQKIKTTAAIGLVLAAAAAPCAWADPQPLAKAEASIAANQSQANPGVRPNPDEQTPVSAPATIVRVNTPSSGFDFGDAGIGAAGGLALSLLGIGGALGVAQHRSRRTRSRSVPGA